jgi:hypothetical protein
MLVPIPGQLAPAAPAPVPTGITYAQSQAAGPNDRLNNEEGGQQQPQQGQSYYDYDRYAQVTLYTAVCDGIACTFSSDVAPAPLSLVPFYVHNRPPVPTC